MNDYSDLNNWLNDIYFRYFMSMKFLLRDELEERLDYETLSNLTDKVCQLGVDYTTEVTGKVLEEAKKIVFNELRMKGLIV